MHKLSLAGVAGLLALAGPAFASIYYIDPENGMDAASGKTTGDPWAHAPGDPKATGGPATVQLKPGDIIRFRAGSHYRGSLRLKSSGSSTAPITYTGLGWGAGKAIFDGSDPVKTVVPCPSAQACGGAPNWTSLQLVTFDPPAVDTKVELFDAAGALYETRYPMLPDPFWTDDIDHYVVTPLAQEKIIEGGRLENAELAAKAVAGGPNMRLAFWVSGNLVQYRKVDSVSGNTLFFTPNGLNLYSDRSGRVALVGSTQTLAQQGSYALLGPDRAVVFPRTGGGTLRLSAGREGIDMQSRSYVTIDGFAFVNGSGASNRGTDGVAILNRGLSTAVGWKITNNQFGPATLHHGRGIISLGRVNGATVQNNRFVNIIEGSGLRAGLGVSNLKFYDNRIARVGRTGLYLSDVQTAHVKGNIIRDIKGVHGNAMSFYLGNNNVVAEYNCVYDSIRPITFEGNNRSTGADNNLTFRYNILVGSSEAEYGITSWGAYTRKVTITGNVAMSPRWGLRLHQSDVGVIATRNVIKGIIFVYSQPAGWVVSSNRQQSLAPDTVTTPDYCSSPGYSGSLAVGSNAPSLSSSS
jgi:hypothetical protein